MISERRRFIATAGGVAAAAAAIVDTPNGDVFVHDLR